jgi:hypothetical protein
MSAFADLVRFLPVAGGTTDWVVSSAVGGCQLPTAANVLSAVSYKVYAVSADLTQWEISTGLYNSGTTTFPRTTVLYNSAGTGTATGQSGAGTKINFSTIPQVSVVAIAEDLISVEVANSFTTTQQAQARTNIGVGTGAAAAKTDQQAATSNVLAVTPLHQQDHDSALKAHGGWTVAAGVVTALSGNYNVTLTRSSAGVFVASFTTPFATANYDCTAFFSWVNGSFSSSANIIAIQPGTRAAGSIGLTTFTLAGVNADPSELHIQCAGRQ